MSLILIDGVDHYPNSLNQDFTANGPWTVYGDIQLYTDGYAGFPSRFLGQNMLRTSGTNAYIQKSFTQESTIVAACAFSYIAGTDSRRGLIEFYDNAGASAPVIGTVKLNPFNGRISYTDSASTVIEADILADPFLAADTWYFIEVKVVAGAGGGVQININGVTWLNTTADNTAPAGGIGIVRFESPTGNNMMTDFYIDNATMHGDCRVITLVPDADNAAVEWVKDGSIPSDCSDKNKCYVDKLGTSPSDAVDDGYVRINAVASDVYGMSDLPAGTWQVKGVMLAARALKESSGSPTLGLSVNSGASSTGSVIPDIKSQVGSLHDFADDAADPWTTANVNAMVLTMSYE